MTSLYDLEYPFNVSHMQKLTGGITIGLNDHGSERFEQIWWAYDILSFPHWLTYLRTWPQVNHIRIPRYTRCRYQDGIPNPTIFKSSSPPLWLWYDCKLFLEIESLDLAWWPKLRWLGVKFVHKMCEKDVKNSFCFALSWETSEKGESQTPRVERRASYHSWLLFAAQNPKLKERRPLPFFIYA